MALAFRRFVLAPDDVRAQLLVEIHAVAGCGLYLFGALASHLRRQLGDFPEHDATFRARPTQSVVDEIRGGAARVDSQAEPAEVVVPVDSGLAGERCDRASRSLSSSGSPYGASP